MSQFRVNFVIHSFKYPMLQLPCSPEKSVKRSESIPAKKISTKSIWHCHFSIISAILGKKWLSPRKKFYTVKNFRFLDFQFKIRFETFWIDSDMKRFFDQNFFSLSFFTISAILVKKGKSPRKNFVMERFKAFWIEFNQIFLPKNYWLCHLK